MKTKILSLLLAVAAVLSLLAFLSSCSGGASVAEETALQEVESRFNSSIKDRDFFGVTLTEYYVASKSCEKVEDDLYKVTVTGNVKTSKDKNLFTEDVSLFFRIRVEGDSGKIVSFTSDNKLINELFS